jgi:hypothetical protein
MNHNRLDESFITPGSNTSELFLKNPGLQRSRRISVMIVKTQFAPCHALGMLRCAMHVIPGNWIGSMERMNARSAPDVRVLTCKGCAAEGITGSGGDRHETTDASSACIRKHALKALMNSVIKEMAVGIDHGERFRERRPGDKVSNNNIDSMHSNLAFREHLSAMEREFLHPPQG